MTDKLSLQSEMSSSWLIQRLQKPRYRVVDGKKIDNPFSFGGGFRNGGLSEGVMTYLREIFSFDYMGSAEFEFGAVPAAIAFLAEQATEDNLITGEIVGVHYVCPKPYEEEVKIRLKGMKKKESRDTKEHVGLSDYFKKDASEHDRKNLGWLELDNGYAFFVDKEMFEGFVAFLGRFKK